MTSAYSSYSGCRQYREDLAAALLELGGDEGRGARGRQDRPYFNHPGFVDRHATDASLAALDGLPDAAPATGPAAVRHALGAGRDERGVGAGPTGRAARTGRSTWTSRDGGRAPGDGPAGRAATWDLVYCSRSGPPAPAVAGARRQRPPARTLARATAVPAASSSCRSASSPTTWRSSSTSTPRPPTTAEELGLPFARAATVGTDPRVRRRPRRPRPRARARGPRRGGRRRRRRRVWARRRRLPGGLLPQPARRPARGVRGRLARRAVARRPAPPTSASDASRDLRRSWRRARGPARPGGSDRDERPADLGVAATKSSPTDVVTEMDRASEQLLRDVLGAARPDDGFLGEEGYGHQPGTLRADLGASTRSTAPSTTSTASPPTR